MPKRDKLGIHATIESICITLLELIIGATFEAAKNKIAYLLQSRIKIESLKHLVRSELELYIIDQDKYIDLQADLQEISKMANGWIKYLNS